VGSHLVLCSLAGYGFARLKFAGRTFTFFAIVGTIMIPTQLLMIPTYVMFSRLGVINTLAAAAIPWLASAFGIFLMRQFFLSLPKELEEAARLDGASYWRIYRTILLPLSKPALLAFGVFSFVGMWGDFLWPLIVINSPEKMTLTVGLNYLNSSYTTDWTRLMAGDVVSLLPLMVVYGLAQRHFIEGISMTGLKG
jgi:multiple sugar transport system permease protein